MDVQISYTVPLSERDMRDIYFFAPLHSTNKFRLMRKWCETYYALKREPFLRNGEFSQFMSHHVLCNHDRHVILPVVYLEADAKSKVMRHAVLSNCCITYPTKLGRIVHDRAFVRIGMLFARASWILGKATKNGP